MPAVCDENPAFIVYLFLHGRIAGTAREINRWGSIPFGLSKKVCRTACKIISGERLKTRWVFKSAEPTDFDDLKNRQNRLMCSGNVHIFTQANPICRRKNIYPRLKTFQVFKSARADHF